MQTTKKNKLCCCGDDTIQTQKNSELTAIIRDQKKIQQDIKQLLKQKLKKNPDQLLDIFIVKRPLSLANYRTEIKSQMRPSITFTYNNPTAQFSNSHCSQPGTPKNKRNQRNKSVNNSTGYFTAAHQEALRTPDSPNGNEDKINHQNLIPNPEANTTRLFRSSYNTGNPIPARPHKNQSQSTSTNQSIKKIEQKLQQSFKNLNRIRSLSSVEKDTRKKRC